MLYDPKWKNKADVNSIHELIAWLETKNPDDCYDYCDAGNCLLCQFLKEVGGYMEPGVGPDTWRAVNFIKRPLPAHFDAIACGKSGLSNTY
ncbi:MAG: hypothetical protein WAN65_08435, partial [Candidatus Sulfotelmatobacter sp.]